MEISLHVVETIKEQHHISDDRSRYGSIHTHIPDQIIVAQNVHYCGKDYGGECARRLLGTLVAHIKESRQSENHRRHSHGIKIVDTLLVVGINNDWIENLQRESVGGEQDGKDANVGIEHLGEELITVGAVILQDSRLLSRLIKDSGKCQDYAVEAERHGIHSICIKPNKVVDEPAVTAASEPPAQRARQQRQRILENVAPHLPYLDIKLEVSRNDVKSQLKVDETSNSRQDISNKNALDSQSAECH